MTRWLRARERGGRWTTASVIAALIGSGAFVAACGDDDGGGSSDSDAGTGGTAGSGGAAGGPGGRGGGSGTGGSSGAGGSGGASQPDAMADAGPGGDSGAQEGGPDASTACAVTAAAPTRGSAIALSEDDTIALVVNRLAGSVSVVTADYTQNPPELTAREELAVGAEPWQVALDACADRAYVVLRRDQKLVELTGVGSTLAKGREVDVGSEPTAVALSPNGTRVYVANWVDGTLTVVDTESFTVVRTVDLNATLAATGLLGASLTARPALAHPRSIAVTNDGDTDDDDEKVYVTEFFAQRTAAEAADGLNTDTNKVGLVYVVNAATGAASAIQIAAIADTGFVDSRNAATACFPNQLQSITIDGTHAYVTSVCASAKGPVGSFQKGSCTSNAQCNAGAGTCVAGSCTGSCTTDADCGGDAPPGTCDVTNGGACKAIPTNFKTLAHPGVHVIDTATDTELAARATNLNKAFNDLYVAAATPDDASRRYPLLANDLAFAADGEAYVTANGVDSVFLVDYDPATAAVQSVGQTGAPFVNLNPNGIAAASAGKGPIGVAVANSHPFALVPNDVSSNVTLVDLSTQAIAGGISAPSVIATTPAPTDITTQALVRGKEAFNTGLGRWSHKGQGWSACQTCHFEGLTDNVTWYFARGPRQSVSLDGSISKTDPTDQRIFNWTAVFDEMADFENVARGLQGGVGGIVHTLSNPPVNTDRIDLASTTLFAPAGASGLNGSGEAASDQSLLGVWDEIRVFVRMVRSPRAPSNLDSTKVAAGAQLFSDTTTGGACQGCHGGSKWTLSRLFYTPSGATNEALLTTAYDGAALTTAGFPAALLPAGTGAQFMRSPNPKSGALDQIQCVLRPVGTFATSPAAVNVVELRQDMTTAGQGNEANGRGFNVPSLLNLVTGAPYFHAGNARTLEELLSTTFVAHHRALAPSATFLDDPARVEELVQYLLSIDNDAAPVALPAAVGATGGDFCRFP